jgi:hypothetical protein
MNKENGSVSVILAVVFGLFFVLALIFGGWAFAGRQDYKNNVDQKISDANEVAVQEAETAKEAEFVEREKSPLRTYTGPVTYGAVSFEYPKTWSLYEVKAASGTVLDLFGFPLVVPGVTNDQTYAMRTEIVSQTYDTVVKQYDKDVKSGAVTSTAYRPAKVPDVLGVRIEGTIEREVQGAMVILPLRDRTIKIYTEIPQFIGDFNNIVLPSLTFVP